MEKRNENHRMTSDQLTPIVNERNVTSVRKMIHAKQNYCKPYYANMDTVAGVLTDQDHFPYTRYFRGVSYHPDPVVFEREAGWREVKNGCYEVRNPRQTVPYPNHCFESACSTVYPCYPSYLQKFSDQSALDVQLNKACIVQYR